MHSFKKKFLKLIFPLTLLGFFLDNHALATNNAAAGGLFHQMLLQKNWSSRTRSNSTDAAYDSSESACFFYKDHEVKIWALDCCKNATPPGFRDEETSAASKDAKCLILPWMCSAIYQASLNHENIEGSNFCCWVGPCPIMADMDLEFRSPQKGTGKYHKTCFCGCECFEAEARNTQSCRKEFFCTGCTCAKGEERGCGCKILGIGCFLGAAKQILEICNFQCGRKP